MTWTLRVGSTKSGEPRPLTDWVVNDTLELCLEEMLYNSTHGNVWRQELIWEPRVCSTCNGSGYETTPAGDKIGICGACEGDGGCGGVGIE